MELIYESKKVSVPEQKGTGVVVNQGKTWIVKKAIDYLNNLGYIMVREAQ